MDIVFFEIVIKQIDGTIFHENELEGKIIEKCF